MYQKIFIIGHVGKEPEMRYTPNGKAVAAFPVATNRKYTNGKGEQVEETIWFRVSAWERMAELCSQFVHRGDKVFVEGCLTADQATGGPRIWTGDDGQPRASFEISAVSVRFLTPRPAKAEAEEQGEEAPFF